MDDQLQRLETLEKQIEATGQTEIASRILLCREMLHLASSLGKPDKEAYACVQLGFCYLQQGDNLLAGPSLLQGLEALRRHGPRELLPRALSWAGIYYLRLSDELGAIQRFAEGVDVAQELGDLVCLGSLHNNIAIAFLNRGAYQQAATHYELACQYGMASQHPGKNRFMHILLTNYAEVCVRMEDVDTAWCFLQMCDDYPVDSVMDEVMVAGGRVCCLAARGDVLAAGELLDHLLATPLHEIDEQHTLCEVLFPVAEAMLRAGDSRRTLLLLDSLDALPAQGSLEFTQRMQNCRVEYALAFGTPEQQFQALEQYYQVISVFEQTNRRVRAEGMKAKIELHDTLWEIELMETEGSAKAPQLENQANIDELSGLYNRRYFNRMVADAAAGGDYLTLGFILLDIDYFKEYNDTYGHQEGDKVLQAVSDCLQATCPQGICPCRYGGDEFVCFCVNQSEHDIEQYLHRLQDCLARKAIPHQGSRCSNQVTLTAGYCNRPAVGSPDLYQMLDWADKAMYRAKLDGRNAFTHL